MLGLILPFALLIPPMTASADDEVVTTTTEATTTTVEQTTTTVVTTVAPSTTEAPATTTAPETTVAPTTTVSSNPCYTEGYACGWAMLDANNNVVNVIVCTQEVCGGGTWDGLRVVLQTRQIAGGNVAGYNGGTYNPSTNVFNIGGGATLVGGSEVGDIVLPSTTSTIHPAPEPVVEETTTTTAALVASAVFGVERTVVRVSTKQITPKRKPVPKKPIKKKRRAR